MSLFEFNQHKQALVEHVINRVSDQYAGKTPGELDLLLEEMIYWEKKRIGRIERSWKQKRKIEYWDDYKRSYIRGSILERQELLRGSIDFYTNQIVGNFSPFVYQLSSRVIPPFLNLLINALSVSRLFTFGRSMVNENLHISGNLGWIRRLGEQGTLIFVPTHMSHLDSILLGTALHYANLPPVMYGAGLNLFRNKVIGFFMNHLGAYKVDRLRVHTLYKDILKEYTASSLEFGFHNLFFPGGTRSRSGAVEKRLKLGLMGSGLTAYIRNLGARQRKSRIYVIPVNLNSHLTLEAETLISDFLAAEGKSRYIIEDDEFSKPQRIFQYLKNHMNLNSKSFVHFGNPIDPFGNRVNEQGESIDTHDRPIAIERYVMKDGKPVLDWDRDQNYTREMATVLLNIFHQNNRVLSTNLVAFTLYEMITSRRPTVDIYQLLRTYAYSDPIGISEFYDVLARVVAFLRHLGDQRKIIYGDYLRNKDLQDILNEALKIFGAYHARKTVYRVGDQLYVGDLLLLYYYHNRLIGYNLEDMLKETP